MKIEKKFKALSDSNRLRIINLLFEGELCVCDIEEILDLTQTNVSRHLAKLTQAEIINSNKRAQWVYYSIDSNFIKNNKKLIDYLKNSLIEDIYSKDREALIKLMNNKSKNSLHVCTSKNK